MKKRILLASIAMLSPGLIFAQANTSYVCTYDDMQRRIEILTEPGVTVPCQVQYYKDTELPGEVHTLWTANSDAAYCDTKAQEFVAKLEGWGWSCAAGGAASGPAPAPEAEASEEPEMQKIPAPEPDPHPYSPGETEQVRDDTEALEPAE